MKIIVCIPTYKRPELLPDCLASVMRLSVNSDIALKVALVDNDSEQSAKSVCEQFRDSFYPFIYLHQPEKEISNARNMGIEYAIEEQADAFFLVDDDMRLPPEYLQQLVDAMRKYSADAVRGLMRIVDIDGKPQRVRRASLRMFRDILAGNGVLVSKTIYDDNHLRFDADYTGHEDGDFFYRAHLKGARLCQIAATFDEFRPPHRMRLDEDRKTQLRRLLLIRKQHVALRKCRGGSARAIWYAIRRGIPLILQIIALTIKLPLSPQKNWRRVEDKIYQIAGLISGVFSNSPPYLIS